MNVTSTQSPAVAALVLNNGRVPVIRGKAVFTAATAEVVTSHQATTIIGSNNVGTVGGYRVVHQTTNAASLLTSGGTSKNSSNSNSQSYIYRRSPNGSNSTGGVVLTEDMDEQSMRSLSSDLNPSPPHRDSQPSRQTQNGLLVQYSDGNSAMAQHLQNVSSVIRQTRKEAANGMATIAEWLNKSPHQNGFIRVFLDPSTELTPNSPIPPQLPRPSSPSLLPNGLGVKDASIHMTAGFSSILVPCSLSTTVEQVCAMIGISPPSLCVQFNSGKTNKLSLSDRPLQIQTNLLAQLGFDTGSPEIMREGIRKSLSFICRFLSAKQSKMALPDVCKRISSYLLVKRPAAVLKTWERRLCSLCGSKLQIHKIDQHPTDLVNFNSTFLATTVFDLAGATITESNKAAANRSHPYTVRIELVSGGSKRLIKLAFDTPEQKLIWTRHLKLAATNQSRSLDLSGSDLELLPEGAFQIAEDVHVLNLKDNQLQSRQLCRTPGDDDLVSNNGSLNPAVLGFLDDIARFRNIQILNLSNNDLTEIPKAVFELSNLTDLNVGNNKIRELSHLVQRLQGLKQLNCQSNRLSSVPPEMLTLRRLVTFNASFNRFQSITETLARLTNMRYTHVEELQLAGNSLGQADGTALTLEIIHVLEQVRKIDLRFNAISRLVNLHSDDSLDGDNAAVGRPLPLASLHYCTILDLSFNGLESLDLREMKALEVLHVNNNQLSTLIVNGTLLKQLIASNNKLEYLACEPNPDFLEKLDVSRNIFKEIPTCFHNCPFLVSANYSHNLISTVPCRYLFNNRRLRFLRLNCNLISCLDDKLFEDLVYVEEFYVQSNSLSSLPDQLFNRAVKLKVLNASKNRIRSLPRPLASIGDISRLQGLYVSGNQLADDVFSSLLAFPRLKFLHLARNRLTNLDGAVLAQLEFLQELNVSENLLTYLPNELSMLSKLQALRAHNNGLVKVMDTFLPEGLQILDLSCNRLSGHVLDIFPRNPLHLIELDLSGNPGLHYGDGEFIHLLSEQLQIMAYDDPTIQRCGSVAGSNFGRTSSHGRSHKTDAFSVEFGVARTAGSRNKPSVYSRTITEGFRSSSNESLAAMFDGGLSGEVPKMLRLSVPDVVEEECDGRSSVSLLQADGSHMKRAFMSAHRELKAVGQRLGASAAICHLVAPPTNDAHHAYMRLFVGNVGDVEVLLCHRDGSFRVLTQNFRADSNVEDVSRAIHEGCVITDNCKVNGVSEVTRMLGSGYLFPAIIPSPNITVFDLDVKSNRSGSPPGGTYATIVIANRNLWRFVTYAEVSQEISRGSVENPLQAAKRLLDLAQCSGSSENIGVIVGHIHLPTADNLPGSFQSQNQQNDQPLLQAATHQVLAVKPWTKERQHRKIAELNGPILSQNNRTSTSASLQRSNAGPLPPAGSLDFNHSGIATPQTHTGARRINELSTTSNNGLENNSNRNRPSESADSASYTTEASSDTVRTAVWVPSAVLHQYGASSTVRNGASKQRPQQQPKDEPQALSIRVDAADNPRKPRYVASASVTSYHAATAASTRQSPPSNNESSSPSLSSQKSASPKPQQPNDSGSENGVAIQSSVPPQPNQTTPIQPPLGALTPESIPEVESKEAGEPEEPQLTPPQEDGDSPKQQLDGQPDDTINSAVESILVPPPAQFGDFEFVSYL